eukprot:222474_1
MFTDLIRIIFYQLIIDFHLFYFGSVSVIEGIWVERSHQFGLKLTQFRSNHTGVKHLYHFIAVNLGLKFMYSGLPWGPGLKYKLGPGFAELKNRKNPALPHPLIAKYMQFNLQTFRKNGTYTLFNKTIDTNNASHFHHFNGFPRVLFIVKDPVDVTEIAEYNEYDFIQINDNDRFSTWFQNSLNTQAQQELHNVVNILFSTSINTLETLNRCNINFVQQLVINDGHKSIWIKDLDKTRDNCWMKVNLNGTDREAIMNIDKIFQVKYLATNKYAYLCYGDIYNIHKAQHCNNFVTANDTNSYNFLDSFTKPRSMLQTKWILGNCDTIVESVIITHNHIQLQQRDAMSQNNAEYSFRFDWFEQMKQYYRYIKHKSSTMSCIPCGPIRVCKCHEEIDCTDINCVNSANIPKWWCNQDENMGGSQLHFINDSSNGWIPGLHANRAIRKRLINLHSQYLGSV